MRYLTLEEILRLHFEILEDYGGTHGVREEGRLLALVDAPQQEVFSQEQYVGVFTKAAVYARNTIADHAFIDGNKRTGITCAAIFLKRNGFQLTAAPKDLEDYAVQIAVEHISVEDIAAWLEQHSKEA